MDRSQACGEQEARLITVKGRVQGVGFRPFLFRLAETFCIRGTVQNNMDGIRMEAEGTKENLEGLIHAIRSEAPRLSRVEQIESQPAPFKGYPRFEIVESSREGASALVIPVDSAVCPECLAEMADPADRRYRYPFITCTQCGPRYTIIRELPYDRPYTSMSCFPMCERCRREYENVRDRRHHAQPIACPDCGPKLSLYAMAEEEDAAGLTGGADSQSAGDRLLSEGDRAVRDCGFLLRQGAIVAVKGLGGYHLACDAANDEAVRRLRQRKKRPTRPLAVMAANLRQGGEIASITAEEEKLLSSPEAPIVIVRKRRNSPLAANVAPGMATVGVMLPYTPLHHLLLEEIPLIVMTSANPSGQPILYRDDEAFAYLSGIADYVLAHNREIFHPLDDSVMQVSSGRTEFLRRSRGFVPDPVHAPAPVHNIAAFGGQEKNTFALGRHEQLFMGPHIGDMEGVETQLHWKREYGHLTEWLGVKPRRIAADLHPQYETGRFARESGADTVYVQHHHAHLISCAADNGLPLDEEMYGIILDGTGYGPDGAAWGFEVLSGSAKGYKRLGHLRYTPLPGGEAAVRQPWRNAAGMLLALFPEEGLAWARELFPDRRRELDVISRMVQSKLNSPLAGTCGRLFDAVSAILGLTLQSHYGGEAAIRLSELAAFAEAQGRGMLPYSYEISGKDGCLELDMTKTLRSIVQDRLAGRDLQEIAVRFHETVAHAAVELLTASAADGAEQAGRRVMLSGGSFHNRYLSAAVTALLEQKGFRPYTHQSLPSGDGGLAFGQLIVAACEDNVNEYK